MMMPGDEPNVQPAQSAEFTPPADTTPAPVDETNPVAPAAGDSGQPDAGEAGEEKPGGQEAGEGSQVSPDTYADLKIPEGMDVDSATMESASGIFAKYNIPKEAAQELTDLYAGQIQAGSQAQVEAYNQLMDDWKNQSSNDKEFGGDKFEESVKTARAAVDKFGTPELKQLLEDHGVGNHPEVIRFMVRVGKLTQEDIPGSVKSGERKAEEDRVSILYGNQETA